MNFALFNDTVVPPTKTLVANIMQTVLNTSDFAAARAVRGAKLKELGFAPVCMAPGEEADGHSHTLVEEILIVQKGHGKIQIENDFFDIGPGSVAIVPAGKFHATCNTGNTELQGVVIFNSNFDKNKAKLKSRKQHFGAEAASNSALCTEIELLKKQNKKLKKKLKKASKR